ncbi:MAG: hypothetical protein J0L79_03565 [Rickettsiales bacterium]|nr:hypothetical protein [Rickettsiales bacterium]MCA0254335.1 hypothetical protein [Pseudomonadota bacterium]
MKNGLVTLLNRAISEPASAARGVLLSEIQDMIVSGQKKSLGPINWRSSDPMGVFGSIGSGNNIFHFLASHGLLRDILQTIESNIDHILAREKIDYQRAGYVSSKAFLAAKIAEGNAHGIAPVHLVAKEDNQDFNYLVSVRMPLGLFKINTDGSNVMHHLARGVKFQERLKFITDNIYSLVAVEQERETDGRALVLRLMDAENTRGFNPWQIALHYNAGSTETATAMKHLYDLGGIRAVGVPRVKINVEFVDRLFKSGNILDFLKQSLHLGWLDLFESIIVHQSEIRDYQFGKYVFQLIEEIRQFPEANEVVTNIYRMIFREYWPTITLADGNVDAHRQIQSLVEQKSVHGFLGMDQEKLINAFGVSEEELLIHGTAIAAVEARLLTGCADSYQIVHKAKAVLRDEALKKAEPVPSPVKIPMQALIEQEIDKDSAIIRSNPELLQKALAVAQMIDEGQVPQVLPVIVTTDLDESMHELEYIEPAQQVLKVVEIAEYGRAFVEFVRVHESLSEYAQDKDVATILSICEHFGAEGIEQVVGILEEDMCLQPYTVEEFCRQYFASLSNAELTAVTSVAFDFVIAKALVDTLVSKGILSLDMLGSAFAMDNQEVVSYSLEQLKGTLDAAGWYQIYLWSTQHMCSTGLEFYVREHVLDVGIFSQLKEASLSYFDNIENEQLNLGRLISTIEIIAKTLSGKDNSVLDLEAEFTSSISAIVATFSNERRLADYTDLKGSLIALGKVMNPAFDLVEGEAHEIGVMGGVQAPIFDELQ